MGWRAYRRGHSRIRAVTGTSNNRSADFDGAPGAAIRARQEINVERYKEIAGRFATGVTVVTSSDHEGPIGFTCQSFMSLSLDPLLVAIAPSLASTSWPRIEKIGLLCINVLSHDQSELAMRFARSGGDKFSQVGWIRAASGVPILTGAIAWLECEVKNVVVAGDHYLVIARVLDLESSDGEPLLFYGSELRKIAAAIDQ